MPAVDQSPPPAAPTRRHWRTTLRTLGACYDARAWCKARASFPAAWNACERGDWLLWIAGRVITDPQDRMLVVLAACDCAETALVHIPAGEDRPRQCIETVRAWTRGEATIEQVREGRRAAYAASNAASDACAASDAAYAASDASDAAYAAYAAYAAACASDAAYAASDASDAAYAAYAAYAASDAAYAASDARTAHLRKLADIVRARIPLPVVLRAFRAAQVQS